MEVTEVEVAEAEVGIRLDRLLAQRLGVSRARVRHLLEVGQVRCGDRVLVLGDKGSAAVAGTQYRVAGALLAEQEQPIPRADLDPQVRGEGPGWVVVDKPAGRPVHPLRSDEDSTVLNALAARNPEMIGVGEGGLRSGVVHRLDVETSGALLFATREDVWQRLRGAFSNHRVDKRYVAIVAGRFERPRTLDLELAVVQHSPARVAVVDAGQGRRCRSRITPARVFETATLVDVELETGFLHQIRVSLAHLGHPVLGDPVYSQPIGQQGGSEVETAKAPIEPARQMLHARRLSIGEIHVEIDPPADFEAALALLAEPE